MTIKFTKNELRDQQFKLGQFSKYLPTLQLKKAMLQVQVNQAVMEVRSLMQLYRDQEKKSKKFSLLLTDPAAFYLWGGIEIREVKKTWENIAGIDLPSFEKVVFYPPRYTLFDTPVWLDSAVQGLQHLLIAREKVLVAREKQALLESELRQVSIRVNLFEKVMIPRTLANIKKIKVFLGDQQLAAVSQAKVAKTKMIEKEGK